MTLSRTALTRAAAALLPLVVAALGACSDDAIAFRPPYLAASTDIVSFGEIMVGESEQRTVFLINSGEVPLKL
ncbi:hypothetical protein, partial [Bradyrhizobium sp. NBAIM08]|uniref:hypothetical protein n=1 Tax=Bradyrhizobium sp. NBAIM08 TaxID=2793815 RepID=UPI001CD3F232